MGLSGSVRREPRAVWVAAGVFIVALLLRLECVRELLGSGLWDYLRLDPLYYHDWAVRISRGDVMGRETYEMTPLYAYALGGLFKLFGYSLLLPRLIQAVLGAGSCAMVALLGCRVFGRAEGLLGGLAFAAYGPALFHDTQIMKTVLTVALSTATATVLFFSQGDRARWLLSGGALLGLTALCQENIDVTLPLLLAWIAWRGRDAPWRTRAARCAALAAGFAIVVSPVTLRNYLVSGDFVLVTTGGGEVFYTGNNEGASGKYQPPDFVRPDTFFEHEDFRAEAARRLGHPVTRKQSDAFWWKEGVRFIAGHPASYAALLWDKLTTYFNDFERPDNYSYYNFGRFEPLLRMPLVRFGWVAPLGILGLALSARRWETLLPLHAVVGCYVLSGLVFFTQDRYRMPMIPLLTLFAAHGAVTLCRAARQRELGTLAWGAPAILLLAWFVNRDPNNPARFEAQNHGILGEMYLYAGRPAEAAAEFKTVLAMMNTTTGRNAFGTGATAQARRMIASAHFGIVLAQDAAGSRAGPGHEETITHLRAASLSPDTDQRRDALIRLGALLLAGGDSAGAVDAYAGAVSADPAPGRERFECQLHLGEALQRSGRAADALNAVEEALREAPADLPPVHLADAHYGEALIYLHDLPDRDQAARHLHEALRLNPSHPRAEWIRQTLATLETVPSLR